MTVVIIMIKTVTKKQKPVQPSNNGIFKNLKRSKTKDEEMVGKAREINWMPDTKGKLWQHTDRYE